MSEENNNPFTNKVDPETGIPVEPPKPVSPFKNIQQSAAAGTPKKKNKVGAGAIFATLIIMLIV